MRFLHIVCISVIFSFPSFAQHKHHALEKFVFNCGGVLQPLDTTNLNFNWDPVPQKYVFKFSPDFKRLEKSVIGKNEEKKETKSFLCTAAQQKKLNVCKEHSTTECFLGCETLWLSFRNHFTITRTYLAGGKKSSLFTFITLGKCKLVKSPS